MTICKKKGKNIIKRRTGKNIKYFNQIFRYNFFTSKDVIELDNTVSIFNLYKEYNKGEDNKTIDSLLNLNNNDKTQYFFIFYESQPSYVQDSNSVQDTFITSTSYKNDFTYEYNPVNGVMANLTALSNLKNSWIIKNVSTSIELYAIIIMAFFIFLLCWNNEFYVSILFSLLTMIVFVIFTYLCFVNHFFFPIRLTLAISFAILIICLFARYFYTITQIAINQKINQIGNYYILKEYLNEKINITEDINMA